ncbi:uncharacterized protein LOC142318114 isoform X2 [Lycorma delicatula]|uniref:uncharacterized protein LOC142318114 isoform X2 n=1 Tax=Lycorma delicatula TaxID=130591 RepID=UPI003F51540E
MYQRLALIGFTSSLGFIGTEAVLGECFDYKGRTIAPGLHYIPGPNTCTLCVCDNGSPRWCKAVLCTPPQNCKSFRVGTSCCEFICLDDTLGKDDGSHDINADVGLRLIAGAITAILSLSILFFGIHRLRQRKIRGRQSQIHDEEGSIGFIAGSIRYLPSCEYEDPPTHYSLWKPPGNYFPRGEAPPPYEEAVAAARVEAALAARVNPSITAPGPSLVIHTHQHRTIPMTLATACPLGSTLVVSEPSPQPTVQHHETSSPCPVVEPPMSHVLPPISHYDEPASHHNNPQPHQQQTNIEVGIGSNITMEVGVAIEENDDYRSECENCNLSAGQGQEYFLEDLETMTLHRRPHEPETHTSASGPYYRTSLTLPTQCRSC